ncbi:hypothetical protein GO013_12485 [Pseudodesulfovibrio sp. JC047]|uniref:GDSL-type esterase/lipase family protein n=1 Tax=Pseudodesulfovibrio sp. JC047 TaxID=2683199 RepID=UPI0013D33F5C|nr:GDSL-type esterase/lipase family protein [Pseudodesulfovibrio sp. JC047]NDV20228.1 hypothetical protein [Pseudodesulfovibrio sp. JC047]
MKKNERVALFGDSIAKGCVSYLQKKLQKVFSAKEGYSIEILQMGISSETSRDGLQRLQTVIDSNVDSAVVNFGMNDWRKGLELEEFERNYTTILETLTRNLSHVVVCTIQPDFNGTTYRFSQEGRQGISDEIKQYNEIILKVASKFKVLIANVYDYWMRTFDPIYLGLEDAIHPNSEGYKVMVQAILPVLIRRQMIVLWQFNGRYAHCNYACPYCYVSTSVNKGMHFQHSIEEWKTAFNRHFGDTHTVFYFSYGEPTLAQYFFDVLDMVAENKNWEAKITTNLSLPLDKLLATRLAREKRLNINTSFHPTQVDVDTFIQQCLKLRAAGIEPSIVYVMYPPQIDDFESKYLPAFNANGLVVHIRAFRGLYRGKKYPGAYTEDQWIKTARYMDRANLQYQLCEVSGLGRLSMIGVRHILVDNFGKIEMCDSYVGDRSYGNVFEDSINLDLEPTPFPGLVPLAAVDDIADYVELEYQDLEGNNLLSYARQGGVYKKEDGTIKYPFQHADFMDLAFRKEVTTVPDPTVKPSKFWLNIRWFLVHFIYSFVIKKYGKWIFAWFRGKLRLLREGKLSLENFWHS